MTTSQKVIRNKVGLEAVALPDPCHLAVVEPGLLGHDPGAPVGPLGWVLLGGLLHDLLFHLLGHLPRAPASRTVFESFDAVSLVAVEPPLDRGPRDVQLLGELIARPAIRRAQNDLCALDLALGGGAGTDPCLQAGPVARPQPYPTRWNSHTGNLTSSGLHGHRTFATLH